MASQAEVDAGSTFCDICNVNCRSSDKYQAHLQSELHKTINSMRDPSTIGAKIAIGTDIKPSMPASSPAPTPTPSPVNQGTPRPQGRGGAMAGPGPIMGGRGSPSPRGMPMPPPNMRGMPNNRGRPDLNNRGARSFPPPFIFGRGRVNQPPTSPGLYNNFVRPSAEGGPPMRSPDPNFSDDGPDGKNQAAKQNRSPGPRKKYHCEVCDATMSGPESFEQHIKGGKHKKVLQKSGASVAEKKVQPVKYKAERALHVQTALDVVTMSLVGLQYLVEFQHPDPTKDPIYECFLCDSQMDVRNVIAHITGLKHKHTYLKIHYAHLLKDVQVPEAGRMPRSGERKNIILQHVDEIAATEGRQRVSVYLWDGKSEKPDVHTGAGPAIKRTAPFPNTGPAAKKQVGVAGPLFNSFTKPTGNANAAGGTSALMKLVEALEGFEIANEVQAGLILKINVSLSNALKKYRNEPVMNFTGAQMKTNPATAAKTTATNSSTTSTTTKPTAAPPKAPGASAGPVGPRPPPPPPQPPNWNFDGNTWQQQNQYGYGDYGYGSYGYDNGFFNQGSYGYGY